MQDLLQAARQAQQNAYAPYSGFKVGAAVRGANGQVYVGCNVENSAYPEGVCAEASAISAMVTAGETHITEILVIGDGGALCSPCGGCRQKLYEFSEKDTPVYVCGPDGLRYTTNVSELLPLAFGPENLADR